MGRYSHYSHYFHNFKYFYFLIILVDRFRRRQIFSAGLTIIRDHHRFQPWHWNYSTLVSANSLLIYQQRDPPAEK